MNNLENIKTIAIPILKNRGVIKSSIFGSYASGEATETSDLYLLVDLPRGKSLFDLVYIQLSLEDALGIDVDVLTYDSVNPRLQKYILPNQIRIL